MKTSILIVVALVLLTICIVLLTGCEFEVKYTTATLSEATMCKSVDSKTQQPIERADVFSTDTPKIYCSVKLSYAPPDTEIKAQWIYIKGEAHNLAGSVLYEDTGIESGSYYLSFALSPPQTGWPIGDYAVKLFTDGKEKITVPFAVQ